MTLFTFIFFVIITYILFDVINKQSLITNIIIDSQIQIEQTITKYYLMKGIEQLQQKYIAKASKTYQTVLSIGKQLIIALLISIPISFLTFFSVSIAMYFMTPYDPHVVNHPNFQIKQTDPILFWQYTLTTSSNLNFAFNRHNITKKWRCWSQAQSEFTTSNSFPFTMNMRSKVDVRIVNLSKRQIQYVKVCLHMLNSNKHQACQKYLVSQNILAFSQLQLYKLSYLIIEVHKRHDIPNTQLQHFSPEVHFDQKLNFLMDFINTYYSAIAFLMTFCLAALTGLAACTCYMASFLRQHFNNELQQPNFLNDSAYTQNSKQNLAEISTDLDVSYTNQSIFNDSSMQQESVLRQMKRENSKQISKNNEGKRQKGKQQQKLLKIE